MAVKIPILILFCFCFAGFLLSLLQLRVVLIMQVLLCGFNSFQMVLGRFRWFYFGLGRFRSFQLIPHFSKYGILTHFLAASCLVIYFRGQAVGMMCYQQIEYMGNVTVILVVMVQQRSVDWLLIFFPVCFQSQFVG